MILPHTFLCLFSSWNDWYWFKFVYKPTNVFYNAWQSFAGGQARQSLFVSQLFRNFIPASSQTFHSKCAIFDIETKPVIFWGRTRYWYIFCLSEAFRKKCFYLGLFLIDGTPTPRICFWFWDQQVKKVCLGRSSKKGIFKTSLLS